MKNSYELGGSDLSRYEFHLREILQMPINIAFRKQFQRLSSCEMSVLAQDTR